MKDGKYYVIGIGELLWDVLPNGKALGGAPANFAYHINNTGCTGSIISSLGDDDNGRELIDSLLSKKLEVDLIQIDSNLPTGTVSVSLDKKGKPSYLIHKNVAWDNIKFTKAIEKSLISSDAICFGSLAQRNSVSASTIRECLSRVSPNCLMVFDINIRQQFYSPEIIEESLLMADVLKINEDEISLIADMFDLGKDENRILNVLSKKFKLRLIALTKGADSSVLFSGEEISTIRTPEVNVVDTVGAGDSFTAVLVSGLLKGDSLRSIHKKAVDVSAWVCTRPGATPEYTDTIRDLIGSEY